MGSVAYCSGHQEGWCWCRDLSKERVTESAVIGLSVPYAITVERLSRVREEREVCEPGPVLRRGARAPASVDPPPCRPPIKPLATFATAPNSLLTK